MKHVSEMIRKNYPEYYSIEHYPADKTVGIRGTKDEWGVFGNFYQAPIVVNGVNFDCTERLFHMMKLRDKGKLCYTLPADALDFVNHLK